MIIHVIVKLNQKEQSILLEHGVYRIGLKSKPVKGRANKELLTVLEEHFNKKARIVAGEKSRSKRVELL